MTTISIENKYLSLELSPEMGGSVTKFNEKKTGREIFRSFPKDKKINKKNCYFASYFSTVPYFGVIQKKTFKFKDKYISLPKTHPLEPDTIHGEGWVSKWTVKNISNQTVDLFYIHNAKKGFPFKYKVYQKFSLNKKSLRISIKIENLDNYPFECGIGFHPWFNISKISKIFINDFSYIKNSSTDYFTESKITNKKHLDLNKQKIDETFLRWNGKSKLLISKNIAIEIKNIKNINNLHVYTPPKENFFCIEPVTNISNAFKLKKLLNKKHGLKTLKPNKKFEAEVEFKLVS